MNVRLARRVLKTDVNAVLQVSSIENFLERPSGCETNAGSLPEPGSVGGIREEGIKFVVDARRLTLATRRAFFSLRADLRGQAALIRLGQNLKFHKTWPPAPIPDDGPVSAARRPSRSQALRQDHRATFVVEPDRAGNLLIRQVTAGVRAIPVVVGEGGARAKPSSAQSEMAAAGAAAR